MGHAEPGIDVLQMTKMALIYIIVILCCASVLGSPNTPRKKPNRFSPYPNVRSIAPAGEPSPLINNAAIIEIKSEERTASLLAQIGNLHDKLKKTPKALVGERARLVREMGTIQKELLTYDVYYVYTV